MTEHQPPRPARPARPGIRQVRLEGIRKEALETGRNRLLVTGALFALVFMLIGGRLVHLAVLERGDEPQLARPATVQPAVAGRADIVDRNGIILATSLPTASLFANPREILDRRVAADKLATALPGLDRAEVVAKLGSPSGFVWLRRNLTPIQQYAVNRLGIPGLRFHRAERRVYPHGRQAAHVLGFTDVDGRGIAGAERYFDVLLKQGSGPLQLSIDIRVQTMVQAELSSAVAEFGAIAGAAVVLDINTGEVVAMSSLPDFDPNNPSAFPGQDRFNRVSKGVYELGSIFKVFTAAMALDSGAVTLNDGYDASQPIRVARFTIDDYHGKKRWLSVPEILVYSSNIGAAKMALDVGTQVQRAYLGQFGLLDASSIELPEVGTPLVPTPVARYQHHDHFLRSRHRRQPPATRRKCGRHGQRGGAPRRHPHQASRRGTAGRNTRAVGRDFRTDALPDAPGGASGHRQKGGSHRLSGGRQDGNSRQAGGWKIWVQIADLVVYRRLSMDAPRYVVLCVLDEPKGRESTRGYATGGWVAAPVVRRLIQRLAPLVGIVPSESEETPAPDPPLFVSASGKPAEVRGRRVVAN